jgi:hypothetical protein
MVDRAQPGPRSNQADASAVGFPLTDSTGGSGHVHPRARGSAMSWVGGLNQHPHPFLISPPSGPILGFEPLHSDEQITAALGSAKRREQPYSGSQRRQESKPWWRPRRGSRRCGCGPHPHRHREHRPEDRQPPLCYPRPAKPAAQAEIPLSQTERIEPAKARRLVAAAHERVAQLQRRFPAHVASTIG